MLTCDPQDSTVIIRSWMKPNSSHFSIHPSYYSYMNSTLFSISKCIYLILLSPNFSYTFPSLLFHSHLRLHQNDNLTSILNRSCEPNSQCTRTVCKVIISSACSLHHLSSVSSIIHPYFCKNVHKFLMYMCSSGYKLQAEIPLSFEPLLHQLFSHIQLLVSLTQ